MNNLTKEDIEKMNQAGKDLFGIDENLFTAIKEDEAETSQTISLEQIKNEWKEYKDKWLRASADYQNLKRNSEKEYAEAFDRGRIDMLKTLLPAIDDLERAWQFGVDFKGIKLIWDNIIRLLEKSTIVRIEPKNGDDFDDNLHEAILTKPVDDEAFDNKICETMLPGYMLVNSLTKNPVIRHAKVRVWKSTK